MGCFCHASAGLLAQALVQLQVPSIGLGIPAAQTTASVALAEKAALNLSIWLGARGLPAAPWQPDPAWLTLAMPQVRMSATAVAAISALASLRAQVQAQLGLDLLNPAQARFFARIIATMNARLSAVLGTAPSLTHWIRLAQLNDAISLITQALQSGLFAQLQVTASLQLYAEPGGYPLANWRSLLSRVRLVAPLLAACQQLGVSVQETAQLSEQLRVLARLNLPTLASAQALATLTAGLSAIARLQLSLGVSPAATGYGSLRLLLEQKLLSLLRALPNGLAMQFAQNNIGALSSFPAVPTFATPAVVQAAFSAQALAALSWNVQATPSVAASGLATLSFLEKVGAVIGTAAVRLSPCASGCDAARIMQMADSAMAAAAS